MEVQEVIEGVEVPVEQVAAIEPEADKPKAEADKAEEQNEDPDSRTDKAIKKMQKRIDALTAKLRAEEAARAKEQEYKKSEPEKPLALEDFDFDENRYQEAVIEQKIAGAIKSREQKAKEEAQQSSKKEAAQKVFDKAIAEFDDFEDVVLRNAELVVTQTMAEAVIDMDEGYKVAYHLGKNPEKAEEIAKLSPTKQVIALEKLRGQLTAKIEKAAPKAPEPKKTVQESAAPNGLSDDMPIDQWMKLRAQTAKRKR